MYHALMCSYPGYTVRKIEEELSVREVKALFEVTRKRQPTNVLVERIERILEQHTGIRFKNISKLDDAGLLAELKGMEWI
ncbi:MAG: hypothetical protein IMZ71_02780 [Chloroflexi bacterium]|nr:hypothetical protein [Chloroflexota bacterium]